MISNAELLYLGSLVAMVPLALVSPHLRFARTRHLYHLAVGLAIVTAVSGADVSHSLFSSGVVYLALHTLPRPLAGPFAFVFAFAYQLYMRTMPSLFTGRPTVSGPCNALQLVLTLKLASVGMDWSAGGKGGDGKGGGAKGDAKAVVADGNAASAAKRQQQKRRKPEMKTLPSPLEYFAYVYYFPGLLTGPFCSLGTYIDSVTGATLKSAAVEAGRSLAPDMLYEGMTFKFLSAECASREIEVPKDAAKEDLIRLLRDSDAVEAAFAAGYGQGPPLLSAALARAFQCLPFAILYVVHMKFFPFGHVLSPEFASYPAWRRVLYSWVSVRTFGLRFPFAWLLAEASCIGSGVAFSGYETKYTTGGGKGGKGGVAVSVARFNAARNIVVREVEFATDLPSVLRNWNISVHQWVKDYVYVRVIKATGSKLAAQVATFATLAYWHGVRPGYYMYFMSVPLLVACAERLGVMTKYLTSPDGGELLATGHGSVLHAVGGWLLTQTAIAYLSAAFIALSFDDTVRAWSLVGWYGHIGAVVLIAITYAVVPRRRRSPKPTKAKTE